MCRGEKMEGYIYMMQLDESIAKGQDQPRTKKYIDILAIYRRCITNILCIEEYEYDIYVRYID